jgi:hypothetical protein
VKPTKPLVLVATTVAVAVIAYVVIRFWDHLGNDRVLGVPLSAPVTLAVLAAAVLAVALGLRSRFAAYREARVRMESGLPREPNERKVKPIDPLQAARALVLAKASGLVGSVFAGIYAGYGLFLIGRLDLGIYRSEALRCGFAFLAGAALVAAAIYLEHILKVPPEQPDGNAKVPSGA